MVPDKEDDEMKAMASVNAKMTVSSNMVAAITPMFVEGASPVGVLPGVDNMPFQFVSWSALQSHVISQGATFAIHKASIGANQEMMPTGDAMYITCGPFACQEGAMAPELSIANSAACSGWDPSVEIQVGKVDNDVLSLGDPITTNHTNDGVDLGILTSSSLEMSVKHVFSGVEGGKNTSITVDAAKGNDKAITMKGGADGYIVVDADEDDTTVENAIDESNVCDNTYASGRGAVFKPENCFRLRGPGATGDASKGPKYLEGWSIEMSPKGAGVTWGDSKVEWEEDPFKDLKCDAAEPVMVADHVDICAMFEAEVDLATGKGWKPEVVFTASTATPPSQVVMWRAGASAGTGTALFDTIWFDDNLNGKIAKDGDPDRARPMTDGNGDGTDEAARAMHDLRNTVGAVGNINKIWEYLTDLDGDLTAGDLGKVDILSTTDNPKTADNETTIELEACGTGVKWNATIAANIGTGCGGTAGDGSDGSPATAQAGQTKANPDGQADNYQGLAGRDDVYKCSESDGGDADEGTSCDAMWTRDVSVLFADGTFGCTTTRDVSITCEWDADGGMMVGRNALPDSFNAATNYANFMKCTAK